MNGGVVVFAAFVMACGSGMENAPIQEARAHPWFDADAATVLNAASEFARAHYRAVEVSPTNATVKTAWQQVSQAIEHVTTSEAGRRVEYPAATRYYMRLDIEIVGPRPFEVRVTGHAARLAAGTPLPTELTGVEAPPWLEPRVDAARVAIYERLKPYAVATRATPVH